MTPREPDRFEAKAKELCLTEWRTIAAALRAEHDDALERAAQWCESQIAGPDTTAQNRWIASRIRALKSPAAAPAAETDAPNGPVCGCGRPSRYESGWCGETSCFANVTPPSEPAAPYDKWAATRGIAAPPAPLLPRVLAAMEQEASNHDEYDSRYEYERATLLRGLAAELRAYIAKGEGKK